MDLFASVFLLPTMLDYAVDPLHLNKIGKFKRLLEATILSKLSDEMMRVVEQFLHLTGFPVRVRRDDKPFTDSWIGRDCDKFMRDADLLLPHLLHLAYAPQDAGPKALAVVRAHYTHMYACNDILV